jgi:tetratricopeptide (TPR) repeat protein
LGEVLLQQGKVAEAAGHFDQARRLQPDLPARHFNLANALVQLGRVAEAVDCYQQAVRLDPSGAEACHALAWILATGTNAAIRNVDKAVQWAERACALTTNRVALYLDTLGVAYAEAGRFSDAIQAAQQAIELAQAAGQTDQVRRIQERLRWYHAGRPYREGKPGAP